MSQDRINEIETILERLDAKLWELGAWLASNTIPYARGEKSREIINGWKRRGINPYATKKFDEW